MGIAGVGRVYTWQGGSLWIGRHAGRTNAHAHHAIQISLALDRPKGRFRLRGGTGDWTEFTGAIVMAHRRHEFDGSGGAVAQIFVDPETAPGAALMARFGANEITALRPAAVNPGADALRKYFENDRGDRAMMAAAQGVIESLAGPMDTPGPLSPSVAGAIAYMSRRLTAPISLQDVAAAVHLSPSRLRHRFVEETGSTYRAYMLWLRLHCAIAAMMRGNTWTDAAHTAGFADSAHLSRTFRRVFGVSPAMLIRD